MMMVKVTKESKVEVVPVGYAVKIYVMYTSRFPLFFKRGSNGPTLLKVPFLLLVHPFWLQHAF